MPEAAERLSHLYVFEIYIGKCYEHHLVLNIAQNMLSFSHTQDVK